MRPQSRHDRSIDVRQLPKRDGSGAGPQFGLAIHACPELVGRRPNSLAGAGAPAMLNPQIETSAFRSGGLSGVTIASIRAREEDLP